MSELALPRPGDEEYPRFYGRYVALVPDGDLVQTLSDQLYETVALLTQVTPERERYRYADGKWSVREVVGHVVDTERVFLYRALSLARGDPAVLPGMEQDVWALNSNADDRPLSELLDEWRAVRRGGVLFLGSLDPAAGARTGGVSGHPITVRALAWIVAGHERHHRNILRTRYADGA